MRQAIRARLLHNTILLEIMHMCEVLDSVGSSGVNSILTDDLAKQLYVTVIILL